MNMEEFRYSPQYDYDYILAGVVYGTTSMLKPKANGIAFANRKSGINSKPKHCNPDMTDFRYVMFYSFWPSIIEYATIQKIVVKLYARFIPGLEIHYTSSNNKQKAIRLWLKGYPAAQWPSNWDKTRDSYYKHLNDAVLWIAAEANRLGGVDVSVDRKMKPKFFEKIGF